MAKGKDYKRRSTDRGLDTAKLKKEKDRIINRIIEHLPSLNGSKIADAIAELTINPSFSLHEQMTGKITLLSEALSKHPEMSVDEKMFISDKIKIYSNKLQQIYREERGEPAAKSRKHIRRTLSKARPK